MFIGYHPGISCRKRLEIGAITVRIVRRNLSPAYARRLYYPLMIFPIPRRHSSTVIARKEMISLEKYAGFFGSVKARGRNKSAKPRLKSMPCGRLARIERGEAERLPPRGWKEEGGRKEGGRKEATREVRGRADEGTGRVGDSRLGWRATWARRRSCVWQLVDIGRRPGATRGGRRRRF